MPHLGARPIPLRRPSLNANLREEIKAEFQTQIHGNRAGSMDSGVFMA